ncbi:hypothetical protein T11_15145 [Trichinella zimbabwensis]|uniref:Uncharacterized protein n=1 Tax=Trichinella zimbabwensis TaxID=268475 RepID=A0A0V1H128_9BILA|nr:hypothetical protein T11_15145 [Trichinella zimbabwensis]
MEKISGDQTRTIYIRYACLIGVLARFVDGSVISAICMCYAFVSMASVTMVDGIRGAAFPMAFSQIIL